MSQSAYNSRRSSGDTGGGGGGGEATLLNQRLAANKANQNMRSPSPNRRFEMASPSTAGNKLAQEIHDEFLVCKICLECYKNPKSLNCLHTFCENCIENHVASESTYKKYSDYREFTCPLCRKRTQLPIGGVKKLPDNFLVSSLSEVVGRGRPSKFPFCDICKMVNRKHREAASKCLDCAKLLCKQCVEMHRDTKVTSLHSIFDVEIEKDIECKEHQDEVVRFYCEPCETCICVLCTFNEHKDHEITQFGDAVTKYKDTIEGMLGSCKQKIQKFDDQIDRLNTCEDVIKEVEQKIRDTAIKYIADVRAREKQLIEEVQNIYGKECMDYIESKKDLATTVDGLRSTCNLTEVILKGKDIELLLLKKDVQAKLTSLGEVDIKSLPTTVEKQVNFIPGELDMGYVHDMDRPVLSKMRTRKIGQNGDSDNGGDPSQWPTFASVHTQTEKSRAGQDEESSDEESDSEESSEEESESEEEEEKPKMEERGVQTDPPPPEKPKPVEKPPPQTKDEGVLTDQVATEEKAVNTRSRSLQSLGGQNRKSPPKESSSPADNALEARRRRRRERTQPGTMGSGYSQSLDIPDNKIDDSALKRRSRFLNYSSMDNDDMFYDAPQHTSPTI